ncbi:putative conserved oligomeric Golgi complex subunit 2 [Apostichopus japonicus]|uniref:Putative conserved oligomeric Golgi complex subunit 2 n=1 Tax=Stichopus japonicus TaxID=307972 RepID=A0A2G8JHX7_STIJA|nr:putative conserved oligomeric Golgi complex subunit 2 [Apostichopus japonicus]
MDGAIEIVEKKMEERKQIGEKKALLQRLINIEKSVEKMELILKIGRADADSEEVELTGQQIERVASEFNQLQYYVTQSKGLPLVEKIRPSRHTSDLKQCLRTYATIDKMKDAEALYQQVAVKPFMDEIINEGFLQNHPQGLKGMFSKILEYVPKHCQLIRQVTCASQSPKGEEVVRGYDFLVNAVWPEIANSLETRTSSIFAPGNPNTFHEKYLLAMEFVDRFERQCGTQASVKRLRSHHSFTTFMAKWSLPVYFQLRFQEIAGALESAFVSGFSKSSNGSRFQLLVSQSLSDCLRRCWDDQIYLSPLCHRFWKLTQQLLSRYSVWVSEIYQQEIISVKKDVKEESKVEEKGDGQLSANQQPANTPVTMGQIVHLATDIDILTNEMLPALFSGAIQPKLALLGCDDELALEDAFNESAKAVSVKVGDLSVYVIDEVCGLSSVHLKAAHDIPRLYRRTNREVTSKPSAYISNALKPTEMFMEEHGQTLSDARKRDWVTTIFSTLTKV